VPEGNFGERAAALGSKSQDLRTDQLEAVRLCRLGLGQIEGIEGLPASSHHAAGKA